MLLQQLVNGLTLGTTYALIALGYTMVYGIIQLINFAHGEVYMIGAFVGLIMVAVYKVNFFLAMLAAMAVCVPLAVLIERVAYRPLRRSTRLAPLISALGGFYFFADPCNPDQGRPEPPCFSPGDPGHCLCARASQVFHNPGHYSCGRQPADGLPAVHD